MVYSAAHFARQEKALATKALEKLKDEEGNYEIPGINRHVYFLFSETSRSPDDRIPNSEADIAVAKSLVEILQHELLSPVERAKKGLAANQKALEEFEGPDGAHLREQFKTQGAEVIAAAEKQKPLPKGKQEAIRTVVSYLQTNICPVIQR